MIWLLPMAGRGRRTLGRGGCKAMIPVRGRPMFEWALGGIAHHFRREDTVIGIATHEGAARHGLGCAWAEAMESFAPGLRGELVVLDEVLPGPAHTVLATRGFLLRDEPCTVVNADQWVVFPLPEALAPNEAFVPLRYGTSPSSSYAEVDRGRVTRLVEKQRISLHASAGVYGFGSAREFVECLAEHVGGPADAAGEHTVGPCVNRWIARGGTALATPVHAKFDLGSEEGLTTFEALHDASGNPSSAPPVRPTRRGLARALRSMTISA